ncbi:MAG: hypothetical protein ACTFAK_15535 [Candidatus Electronema sp. VV]
MLSFFSGKRSTIPARQQRPQKALDMPAMAAASRTEWDEAFKECPAASGKPLMVIICAMMRTLAHVAVGILKSRKMFDPAMHGTYSTNHFISGGARCLAQLQET